ncbi:MAG: hypothetical protein Q9186_001807 [Xanthomendoza sp. 1 TL-2023]
MAGFKLSILVSAYLHLLLVSSMVSSGRHGHGLIGYGISMYNPLCAYACRDVLSSSTLNCSEHAHMHDGMVMKRMAMGSETVTSPACYAADDAFLNTLAYCISTHCHHVPIWHLEKYWSMNVAGKQPDQPPPKATYQKTLAGLTTTPTDILVAGEDLSHTMIVSDEDYQGSFNAQAVFEDMEHTNERYGIALLVSGAIIPIAFSLLRFLPFPTVLTTKFNCWFIDPPALGTRHKTPIAGLFHMPTRGQAIFIFYLIAINVILSSVGFKSRRPNSWYPTVLGTDGQTVSYVTNRAGVLSFANIPLLFLYAGRNNVLLWLTNWSHGTFLLLHRWVAWIATLQAILHSVIYLHIYVHDSTHASESKLAYWVWGVVATLCMSIMLPASILPIRKHLYEFFLAWHILLSIFVLVGCLWHILERFQHQWGYENWMYTAIAIWGFERFMRVARLARTGVKTARVTVIDDDYIRVNIEEISGSGHAFLYFPTLTWRVWENHPFSVASTVLPDDDQPGTLECDADVEKLGASSAGSDSDSRERWSRSPTKTKVGLTFLVRTKGGITGQLRKHISLPVLVESAYGPHEDLSQYSLLICIAGGVGITACVPYLRAHPGATKLFWGARSRSIIDAMARSLTGVEQETYVGKRMNITDVLHRELVGSVASVAVLVSGPSEMADEVRYVLGELGRQQKGIKVKLLEEAFSW